jgi:hypothetical protein
MSISLTHQAMQYTQYARCVEPDFTIALTCSVHDEALTLALREIIARRIAEAEKRKQRKGKDHTVA